MKTVTCAGCGAQIPESDVYRFEESQMKRHVTGAPTPNEKRDALYCVKCACSEYPNRPLTVRCAGCQRVPPVTAGWPGGWIGITVDGSIYLPVGSGAHVVFQNLPAGRVNEVACSMECFAVVRDRRSAREK